MDLIGDTWNPEGDVMVKSILDIGNAKYEIDRNALRRFMHEAKQSAAMQGVPDIGEHRSNSGSEAAAFPADESIETIFIQVMQLYNEYAVSGSLDVLIKLKCELEQVSSRYKSLALAEEVLNINSCLPYEWRVRCCSGRDH